MIIYWSQIFTFGVFMEGFYIKSRITENGIYRLLREKKLKPQDKFLYDFLCMVACFKEQPFQVGKKNVTVGVGEYIISRRRLLKEMVLLGIFDSEGGLRRSVERLKECGLISTESDGQSALRFRILHYDTDYVVEPILNPQNTTNRAQLVSQPNQLTNKVNTEAVSQDSKHLKEEWSIKEECNSSNNKDTYIPKVTPEPDREDSGFLPLYIDENNNGPEGPYCMDVSDIQVSEDDYIYVVQDSDDDSIDTDFNNPTHSQESVIPLAIDGYPDSPLGSGLDDSDDEWDEEDEDEYQEEGDDSDDIDREFTSPPDTDPRLREYKEEDLHPFAVQLAKERIAKHFGCYYHELPDIEKKNPEEYARMKAYYINFMGRNYSVYHYAENVISFLNDLKTSSGAAGDNDEYLEEAKNCLSDEIIETIREQRLNEPATCFLDRLDNYIVKNMVNPYEVNMAYVFNNNVLDGILKTPNDKPDYKEYSKNEWKPAS